MKTRIITGHYSKNKQKRTENFQGIMNKLVFALTWKTESINLLEFFISPTPSTNYIANQTISLFCNNRFTRDYFAQTSKHSAGFLPCSLLQLVEDSIEKYRSLVGFKKVVRVRLMFHFGQSVDENKVTRHLNSTPPAFFTILAWVKVLSLWWNTFSRFISFYSSLLHSIQIKIHSLSAQTICFHEETAQNT